MSLFKEGFSILKSHFFLIENFNMKLNSCYKTCEQNVEIACKQGK